MNCLNHDNKLCISQSYPDGNFNLDIIRDKYAFLYDMITSFNRADFCNTHPSLLLTIRSATRP